MNAASTLPLSLSQKDLIFFGANANSSIRLKGKLSVHALRRALAFMMRRHEGLRMRIVRSNQQAHQRLAESIELYDLPITCVKDFSAAEEGIKTSLSTPADLENVGPIYAELMRVSEDDHVLLLVIHPVAIDGYALALITRELLISCDCYTRDKEPCLPSAMRYTDYVLNDARARERLSHEQVQYWRSVLHGSRHPIPRKEGYCEPSVGRLRVITASISAMETKRLEEFASAANVSMAAVLYEIIFLSVSKQYSADDIAPPGAATSLALSALDLCV